MICRNDKSFILGNSNQNYDQRTFGWPKQRFPNTNKVRSYSGNTPSVSMIKMNFRVWFFCSRSVRCRNWLLLLDWAFIVSRDVVVYLHSGLLLIIIGTYWFLSSLCFLHEFVPARVIFGVIFSIWWFCIWKVCRCKLWLLKLEIEFSGAWNCRFQPFVYQVCKK